jgi:DNA-binding CsgD family transcriptional regulator
VRVADHEGAPLVNHATRIAADLTYHIGQSPDRDTYLMAAATSLQAAVPGDVVVWTAVDMAAGPKTQTWFNPAITTFSERLHAAAVTGLPLAQHYFTHPDDTQPRRISECVSDRTWWSSRAYSEFFTHTGARFQMGMATILVANGCGCGWAVNRTLHDFTDTDIERAAILWPVLALLDQIFVTGTLCTRVTDQAEEIRQRSGLTQREHQMIKLAAQGLTTKQIARLTRVQPSTVAKHLENAYRKLDCNGRVNALNRARSLGLL